MTIQRRKRIPIVNYTARDFQSIREELNNYKRRYFANVSRDENEASFDAMMIDLIAYVGDQMSFFADYATNESFLQTSIEYNNILKIGKSLGFKFRGNPTARGKATFFILVPAKTTGLGPNPDYIPVLKRGTQLSTSSGNGFILNEDVRFDNANNDVVVGRVDQTTGIPTAYVIRAEGEVISGRLLEEFITVGAFEKFLKVELAGSDISEILSVQDSEGNEFFEVEFLSQDVIFKEVQNQTDDKTTVPLLLKPFVVPRRFIVERERSRTFLQFGFGSEDTVDTDPLIDPSQIVLDVFGKNYVNDVSFDPTNLLGTDKLGIVPANTILRIVYRANSVEDVNASKGSVNEITGPLFEFDDISSLNIDLVRSVVDSVEVSNENAIVGDVSLPTVEELKIRIFDNYGSQNRAVTEQDYRALCYSMPPRFGALKRVSVFPDPNSFKRNLNLYVVAEDANKTLAQASNSIKQNLRSWILKNKMINDTIDLLDAKILNLAIQYEITIDPEMNKFEVLTRTNAALRKYFSILPDIGENFKIRKIYDVLNAIDGVDDTKRVKVFQRVGGNYSDLRFNLDQAISNDGREIIIPKNVIYEIKYLDSDLQGTVV